MTSAYYNEFDHGAAAWLRELIAAGLIADGDVDERSILDVQPADLAGYDQCHFFAGIGGWSLALRLAGVPDSAPVWTGSCPCQPFSVAGKAGGVGDERHLWPAFRALIAECRPAIVFGEQVASRDGRLWLSGVRADLEKLGFAVGGADLCAAGVGAPHIRQRLYWCGMADTESAHWRTQQPAEGQRIGRAGSGGDCGGVEDAARHGTAGPWSDAIWLPCRDGKARRIGRGISPLVGRVADAECDGRWPDKQGRGAEGRAADGRNSERLPQPGPAPLVDGVPAGVGPVRDCGEPEAEGGEETEINTAEARVMRLKGYGNAICVPLAAEFVQAVLESLPANRA